MISCKLSLKPHPRHSNAKYIHAYYIVTYMYIYITITIRPYSVHNSLLPLPISGQRGFLSTLFFCACGKEMWISWTNLSTKPRHWRILQAGFVKKLTRWTRFVGSISPETRFYPHEIWGFHGVPVNFPIWDLLSGFSIWYHLVLSENSGENHQILMVNDNFP
jgi:hypothetical protein